MKKSGINLQSNEVDLEACGLGLLLGLDQDMATRPASSRLFNPQVYPLWLESLCRVCLVLQLSEPLLHGGCLAQICDGHEFLQILSIFHDLNSGRVMCNVVALLGLVT